MALRPSRVFSTSDAENVVGNPLLAKRGLQPSKGIQFSHSISPLTMFSSGTSNLQRSALGEIKNTRHNSISTTDQFFKEPQKPVQIRAPKVKENASSLQKANQVESMDISNNEIENPSMEEDQIEDIDAEDAGNPQLVVEYVNDIYNYLR